VSITSANAVLIITVPNLFNAPQQIQDFSVDDIYDMDDIAVGENLMGVDGILTSGFVFNPVTQNIMLQADSPSNLIFEQWYQAELQLVDKYAATASITLNATGRKYTQTNGYLTSFSPAPSAGKTLKPRKYGLTWQSVIGAPANANVG
jgi:hypothetical protein